MNNIKFLDSFESFARINEMASNLTKLGVAKDLMQFIHKLKGDPTRPRQAQKQLNPKTGKMDIQFHTAAEPDASKKGPWPATEDVPLSHDIEVQGTKTGINKIRHYLEKVVPKNLDTDPRLILVTPSEDLAYYITRKTGKTSPAEREAKYGVSDRNMSREMSRYDAENPVSEKIGMYIRTVTIDLDSGEPIARWEGTIGQMFTLGLIKEDSILYVMEKEDRVREKRKKRHSFKKVSMEDFVKYFMDNFENIARKFVDSGSEKAKRELESTKKQIDPTQLEIDSAGRMVIPQDIVQKINKLKKVIQSSSFDKGMLLPKLNNFLELAMKEGEYEPAGDNYLDRGRANLSQMVDIHTMPVVASMFLQYIALGKVYKKFHSDNVIADLGLEDLF
jgi:DNA-binding transcriptional regulator/RsmH inhibitor MraZ